MSQQASLLAQLIPEPSPDRPYVHPSQYRAVPNVRHYSDGMHKLYQPNLVTLAIAVVTLGLYISIPHVLMGLFVAAFFSRTALLVLTLLMITLLMPAKPLRVPSVLSSYVFLCWRRYFKFSYLFEQSLDCYEDYIIAQFPHGAFPLGALLGGTFMATEYPEYPCYALAANAAFLVPLWRHVHAWLGTEACTKTNFHKLLAKGVKGPLPARHRHSHTQLPSNLTPTAAGPEADELAGPQGERSSDAANTQQQQYAAKPVAASPFNSCAAALAAAADGVGAIDAVAAITMPAAGVAAHGQLGPFASAAVLGSAFTAAPSETAAVGGSSVVRSSTGVMRRTNSAPLTHRLSQALSLPTTLFRPGHTLSDSESSESESDSEGQAGEEGGGWETCCACGSGLHCRSIRMCSAMAAGSDSSSDGASSRRSSSSSGASMCSCCGAVTVLAEIPSLLPVDSLMRLKHQSQSLMTIPSDDLQAEAAAALDAATVELPEQQGDDTTTPLLQDHQLHQQQEQQQPRLAPTRRQSASAALGATHKHYQHQQLLPTQQQQQQQEEELLKQQQPDLAKKPGQSSWRVDPRTGARKLGVSVGLMVGGIAEMFMIRPDHERIKLKERKGFIRIAVEHGVDILPVYIFGVNQALSFGPPWLQRASRKMRASLGVIYGAWGLPIPRRVPIFKVTGTPIHVGPPMRKDHPDFAARVDELHAEFCREIERIYYAHRGKYGHGFENRPLVIC